MADPFHIIADFKKIIDEARRIEHDAYHRTKIKKRPKKIFLVGGERLIEEEMKRLIGFLDKCQNPKGFN